MLLQGLGVQFNSMNSFIYLVKYIMFIPIYVLHLISSRYSTYSNKLKQLYLNKSSRGLAPIKFSFLGGFTFYSELCC